MRPRPSFTKRVFFGAIAGSTAAIASAIGLSTFDNSKRNSFLQEAKNDYNCTVVSHMVKNCTSSYITDEINKNLVSEDNAVQSLLVLYALLGPLLGGFMGGLSYFFEECDFMSLCSAGSEERLVPEDIEMVAEEPISPRP